MAIYIVIKLAPSDGVTPPKIISDISNSQMQLTEVISSSIVKKWDVSSIGATEANEIANLVSDARTIVSEIPTLDGASVYADEIEIV